ncbi:MAG: DNA-formamidopyrimidine glycosylase family protein, partial [Parcubacteria group bacterium]
MPELPDLTVFSENLSRQCVGKKIGDVSVLRTKPVLPMPTNQFIALLQGKFFQRIERRGKQLVFVIDDMNELWVHLMLHGEIYALQPHESVPAAACIVIGFQDKTRL